MKTDGENKKILFTPRSMGIFLVQYFASVAIITSFSIIFIVITSPAHAGYGDHVILIGGFIIPPLLAGFLMLYLPQQYRTSIIFDGDTKLLQKIKKGTVPQQFNLTNAQVIIAKIIKTMPGCKFVLIIENASDDSKPIFREDTNPTFGAKNWLAFGAQLSKITGLPLKKEYYLEQLDGTLSKIAFDEGSASRRHGLMIICIPLTISFIGALIFKVYGTSKEFIIVGGITVVINIVLSFLYAFLNRDKLGYVGKHDMILIAYILTLLIPYSLYYLFFIFLLSGCRWPLSN
jgi:hypothetical protein